MLKDKQEWDYYCSPKVNGSLPLSEIIKGFQENRIGIHTFFKRKDFIYWKKLKDTPELYYEVCRASHWDYILGDQIIKKVLGSELIRLFKNEEIQLSTQVRFSDGDLWDNFGNAFLSKSIKKTVSSNSFQGFTAVPITWQTLTGRMIDRVSRLFLVFLIIIITPEGILPYFGKIDDSIYRSILLLFLCNVRIPWVEAFFIKLVGGSLGTKFFRLNILNVDGSKLTFAKALRRQSDEAFTRRSDSHEYFSATAWDVRNGVVVTDQKPGNVL
jgi:hypothetical protein